MYLNAALHLTQHGSFGSPFPAISLVQHVQRYPLKHIHYVNQILKYSEFISIEEEKNEDESEIQQWRMVLQTPQVYSQLTENTDPIELLTNAPDLVTQAEEQEIRAKCLNSGNIRACELLLSFLLQSKNHQWPNVLRDALRSDILSSQLLESRFQDFHYQSE